MKTRMMSFGLVLAAVGGLNACTTEDDMMDDPVDPGSSTQKYSVRIENISDKSTLPTPFAPGAWALHSGANPLFTEASMARLDGLEALAEDGDPSTVAAALSEHSEVASSGAFDTPTGSSGPAPIFPGEDYRFEVEVDAEHKMLSLASMLVHSNDLFVAPAGAPIALFDGAGMPVGEMDITDHFALWDAGTERNQAPGAGPDQAPLQSGPNAGSAEGVVSAFSGSTRALARAERIVDVMVSEQGGAYEISLHNISASAGAMITPLAPVFYATHDGSFMLFSSGGQASAELEELAEDGSPAGLVAMNEGMTKIGEIGAQLTTLERPQAEPGPAMPGERYSFSVMPSSAHPWLSLAAMVVESNDAFIALDDSMGIRLIDSDGMARPAAEIQAELQRRLAVWDAGTEANEVPGVGMAQAPRQAAANTGGADPDSSVRLHADPANDLSKMHVSELFAVIVRNGVSAGSFDVTVVNNSGMSAYPTPLTPVVYAVHDGSELIFEAGMRASTELERLAEDGDVEPLAMQLDGSAAVSSSGVQAMPEGAMEPGPLFPGHSYRFTVMADANARYLNLAAMVVQSNDAFIALGSQGIELVDSSGMARSDTELAAEVAEQLSAWDAGTEANQVGAAGPDQPLRQMGANSGPAEGDGSVRIYDDPVWSYPALDELLRVTITPVM